MNIKHYISLKPFNTFGIEVFAKYFVSVTSLEELKSVVLLQEYPKKLIIGGGSNLLLTKDFEGLVIQMSIKGIEKISETDSHVIIKANAGENWHEFVLFCLDNNFGGIENLSLIPGNVGTAPIQNIGAYGVELKDVFERCEVLCLKTNTVVELSKSDCQFGYRDSIFKNTHKEDYIVISVVFKLTKNNHQLQINYGDIKQQLHDFGIQNPTIKNVSDAIIAIRERKLPNPKEIGNSGSFFKNPVISKSLYEKLKLQFTDMPHYPVSETEVKVPAGWLIEQAGFKGKAMGNYGVHKNQALVLVNYGGAKGQDILNLAILIQETIKRIFEISLEMEVNVL